MITLERVANETGNLLDRRKFHMMKSGSPRGMVGGKMRRPATHTAKGLERLVRTLRNWPVGWRGPSGVVLG